MKTKTKLEDYTEEEFLELLELLYTRPDNMSSDEFERRTIEMVKHFEKITEHPAGSDVIFYPEEVQEDSPEGILKTVKEWREMNGKSGFKSAEDNLLSNSPKAATSDSAAASTQIM